MSPKKVTKTQSLNRPLFYGLGISVVLVLCVVGFEIRYWDRYFPGVEVNGRSVGGKTYEGVLEEFKNAAEHLEEKGLELVFVSEGGEKKLIIPDNADGFTPDASISYFSIGDYHAAIDQAYSYGRRGSIVTRISEQFSFLECKTF